MNIVYIDVQNTHKATKKLGWLIDWKKFFVYLKSKCSADIVYYAVGYVEEIRDYYKELESYGYKMLYKKTGKLSDGTIKGNVDVDITIRSVLDVCENSLSKAYIITNDGDFNSLVDFFKNRNVFGYLIVPDYKTASFELKKSAGSYIQDMQRLRHLIEKV